MVVTIFNPRCRNTFFRIHVLQITRSHHNKILYFNGLHDKAARVSSGESPRIGSAIAFYKMNLNTRRKASKAVPVSHPSSRVSKTFLAGMMGGDKLSRQL